MKRIIIFTLVFCSIFILPVFIKSLRYDFINHGGNGPSSSTSKEESIKRGVYVCDLTLGSFNKTDDHLKFGIKKAWVEKAWWRGAWYWDTKPLDIGYNIIVYTSLNEDEISKLNIINNRKSALGDYEGLGCCCEGECYGSINKLPSSDTIKYNLLKEDNIDFSDRNIIGELTLVLNRD